MPLSPVTSLWNLQMYFKSANQGWSERIYIPTTSATGIATAARTIVDYRLALLVPNCSLVYAKYSDVGPKADSIPLAYAYPTPGTYPGEPFVSPATAPPVGSVNIEVSQIAVLVRYWTAEGKAASRWIHGVPDARVDAEVLTSAIVTATAPPPAVGTLTAADDWATRFGYYMYQIKSLGVYARKAKTLGGAVQWSTDLIDAMIVRGVSVKKTGAPFGQRRGHVPIGR